jgi:putative restriction endonuclease
MSYILLPLNKPTAIIMKEGQKLWTREELLLAINLYCKIPFGKMHSRNPDIIQLATLIGRTPSSVSLKLVNFASLDPSLQKRGIKGAVNTSKLDKQIWNEFYGDWSNALFESEQLLAIKKKTTIERLNKITLADLPKEGKEKERTVRVRVNQSIFREMILAAYNNTCCITGINNTELLIASHIVAWSKDEKNRLNPMNGLCLNALHDKAFDRCLITISAKDYSVRVSSKLKAKNAPDGVIQNFINIEGNIISLPDKFLPAPEFLKQHNKDFQP